MSKMRYMELNVFFLNLMSMYPTRRDAGFFKRILAYFWRAICVLSLGSLAALCITDIFKRNEFIFVDVSSNFMNTGIFLGGTIRISYYYFFGEKVRKITERMNALFRDRSETGLVEKDMKTIKFGVKIFCWYWAGVVFVTGVITALIPLAFIKKNGKVLPIQAWYPYDWKLPGWFEFTYFTQILTQFFMGFAYGNPDMFYASCMCFSAGQFRLIGWEMENVLFTALLRYGLNKERVVAFSKTFNDFGVKGKMDEDVDLDGKLRNSKEYDDVLRVIRSDNFAPVLKQSFVDCVRHHQELLDFCQLFYTLFSPLLLPSLMAGLFYTIFIPFTLLVTTGSSELMVLVEYFIASFAQVFVVAFFGQVLTTASETTKVSLYACPWYLCDSRFLSNFKFAQFRAFKPFTIRAASYFVIELALFLNLCRTSFSYIAVLRQLTE